MRPLCLKSAGVRIAPKIYSRAKRAEATMSLRYNKFHLRKI